MVPKMNRDAKEPLSKCYTHKLNDKLSLRIYSDNSPRNLDTAAIHKGLILVSDGVELVEEGSGFGLPVVKFGDRTFFPGSATLIVSSCKSPIIITKTYEMNMISSLTLGGRTINTALVKALTKLFTRFYFIDSLQPILSSTIGKRELICLNPKFLLTNSRGEIEVKYSIHSQRVEVNAEARLRMPFEEIVLLNEQGASTFRSYRDEGGILIDESIGAWKEIHYDKASLMDINRYLSFSIEKPIDARLYRGRESAKEKLSWSGLELSFNGTTTLRYNILISGNVRGSIQD